MLHKTENDITKCSENFTINKLLFIKRHSDYTSNPVNNILDMCGYMGNEKREFTKFEAMMFLITLASENDEFVGYNSGIFFEGDILGWKCDDVFKEKEIGSFTATISQLRKVFHWDYKKTKRFINSAVNIHKILVKDENIPDKYTFVNFEYILKTI